MNNTTDNTIGTKDEDGALSLANSLLLYKIGKNYTGSLYGTITTSGTRMSFVLTNRFKIHKHREYIM